MPRKAGTPKTGGRQRGTHNKKTTELIEQAAAGGVMPLDVMLENMRHAYEMAKLAEATFLKIKNEPDLRSRMAELLEEEVKYRQLAQDCAKDAAPYLHSRLTATEVTGADHGPIVHEIVVRYVKADHAGD